MFTFSADRPIWASFHLLEQPPLHGHRDRLAPIPHVKLLQDVRDMVLDRMRRDVQLRGDLFVWVPLAMQARISSSRSVSASGSTSRWARTAKRSTTWVASVGGSDVSPWLAARTAARMVAGAASLST